MLDIYSIRLRHSTMPLPPQQLIIITMDGMPYMLLPRVVGVGILIRMLSSREANSHRRDTLPIIIHIGRGMDIPAVILLLVVFWVAVDNSILITLHLLP